MRLLDAFCGAGGCAKGYAEAGFDEIVGVDIEPQPNYPYEFIQADAVEFITRHGRAFDAIHASPPCKVHTSLKAFAAAHHENLIPATRDALRTTDRHYVIENVPGSPLITPLMLCGSSFGLRLRRHRLFECTFAVPPKPCEHEWQDADPIYAVKRYHSGEPETVMSGVVGVYGRGQGLGPGEVSIWREQMRIDWMTKDEMREAIPPPYTEYIGRHWLDALAMESAA